MVMTRIFFTFLAGLTLAQAAELEITPGYRSCSVNLNNCRAADYSQIEGTLHFRAAGGKEWRTAPEPVLIRHEKSYRSCLLDLAEDCRYELKLTVDDDGNKEEFIREFQTLGKEPPIARTVLLDPNQRGAFKPESGSPDGYIRYSAPLGFVFDAGKKAEEAIRIDGASYIIIDGLVIRGARKHGITITNSHHIIIRNCDIAGYGRAGVFRPDLDGKFYVNDKPIWHDAGIQIIRSENILAERNYIHDPDAFGNSWLYSHPAGPTGFYVGDSASVTLRYNDVIGSDLKRWNDGIDGMDNFSPNGGFRRDAEIYGNYFAFGDDDGIELDGGQQSARFFYNKVEGFYCGISVAPCLRGPSYVYRNLFCNPGDEFGLGGTGIKMISGVPSIWGTVFLWGNDIFWSGGISYPPIAKSSGLPLLLLHSRENRYPEEMKFYPQPKSPDFRVDINDAGSVSEYLPPKLTELPFRPAGFSIDKTSLRFVQKDQHVHSEQITITADSPGFSSEFRIVAPEASKHFQVTPSSGVLEYGKPVTLTVSSAPDDIRQARRHIGAFAIRLVNGFSRPISVETDSRMHPELRRAAHSNALYGKIVKTGNGEAELVFEVPQTGKYFLFVKSAKNSSSRAIVRLNDSEPELRFLTSPLYTENPWRNVAEMQKKQQNLPFQLEVGRQVFRISRQPGMHLPDYTECLIAGELNGFLYAP